MSERREADRGFQELLDSLEARRIGLPDRTGWTFTYTELVRKFLEEALIPSERRRAALKHDLEANLLQITTGADLGNIGTLTARCRKLLEKKRDVYVIKCVQQPVKQLSAWAASIGLLPYDPLAAWKKIQRVSAVRKRRAFLPDEMRAILEAAVEIDTLLKRKNSSAIIFKTLLLTGNRPGAILRAHVKDLLSDRISLPSGVGCKRNGMATLPHAFVPELKAYIAQRGKNIPPTAPLFVSHTGKSIDGLNITDDFKRCLSLAFVRMCWPSKNENPSLVEPIEVAYFISTGRSRCNGGPKPKKTAKILVRERKHEALVAITNCVRAEVERRLVGTDLYCLRKTHISWARRLVNSDSVKLQVGHAPQDVEERHYLDLVDAHASSEAVWDVLIGVRSIQKPELKIIDAANNTRSIAG